MISEVTVGAASLMGALVFATGVVRWAVAPVPEAGKARSRRQHRAPRSRPVRRVEEYVPAAALIPAFAGAGWPNTAFAYCIGCHHTVPVVVHDSAHRCDRGHVTIHTIGGNR